MDNSEKRQRQAVTANSSLPHSQSDFHAQVIPRKAHPISRKNISRNALKVLYRLHEHGFESYLVGGCIRDLLMGVQPKDFDVVTNATPEQIKKLFNNCRLIGRRFRLAHIIYGRDIIEVATFRGSSTIDSEPSTDEKAPLLVQSEEGQLLRDNIYGTIEEDARRRDFSINALYYSISDFTLKDYSQGMQDIALRQIRMMGDPAVRYREDPVRILRALRFASKLNMQIEATTLEPIPRLGHLLTNIPTARLYEESLKLLLSGCGLVNFQQLHQYQLLQYLLPSIHELLQQLPDSYLVWLELILLSTDERVNTNKSVTPAFFFAAALWPAFQQQLALYQQQTEYSAFECSQLAIQFVLDKYILGSAIPKRHLVNIREIWEIQYRWDKNVSTKAFRLINHPRFKIALDFLLLRSKTENHIVQEQAKWWSAFATKHFNPDKLKLVETKKKQYSLQRLKRPPKISE